MISHDTLMCPTTQFGGCKGVSSKSVEQCRGAANRVVEVSIEMNCVVEHMCRGAQVSWKYVVEVCRGAHDTL